MKTSHLSIQSIKGKLLAAALPVCLALASQQALAVDAARGVAGASRTIDSTVFIELVNLTFLEGASPRRCIAVASAELQNPIDTNLGKGNNYDFGLFHVQPNGGINQEILLSSPRTVELNDATGNDNGNRIEVSTTAFFTSQPNVQNTVRWKARKVSNAQDVKVNDSNLSVMCFDAQL